MTSGSKKKTKRNKLEPTLRLILNELGGQCCCKVAEELYNIETDEITDDHLAEMCNIKLNIVRKILYILYNHKLADFRKVRDKKSGWFIYYWHNNYCNIENLVSLKHTQVLNKMVDRLQYEEENVFYRCTNPDEPEEGSPLAMELKKKRKSMKQAHEKDPEENPLKEIKKPDCLYTTTFDNAMDSDFKCPQCGGSLDHYENAEVKDFLREKVAILRENIKNTCK